MTRTPKRNKLSDYLGTVTEDRISPRVTHLSWGRVEVEPIARVFKDVKLYPGGAREWDWRETGTRHVPGIKPSDVTELIDRGSTAVILSIGMDGRLRVMPETLTYLEQLGIKAYVLTTTEAIKLYNELREQEPIGALIHSTC
jgi:hypothetical protein